MRFSSKPNYAYWSAATGVNETAALQECIKTAREVGVFHEFHVMTDRELEGCDCYDAMGVDQEYGLHLLIYLKAVLPRLSHEYFIWLSPYSEFSSVPRLPLSVLGNSPMHVPLFESSYPCGNHSESGLLQEDNAVVQLRSDMGLTVKPYFGCAGFWVIHRDAVDLVAELSMAYWNAAKEAGLARHVDDALTSSLLRLCGDPSQHLAASHTQVWEPSWKTPLDESRDRGTGAIQLRAEYKWC